jgi:CheY-like chemotaxis protein
MSEQASKKILIIDDEPAVVAYLETLLQDNGYATIGAANGREGLEKMRAERPDLVCLDITMPEKSGIAFYREIKDDPELQAVPVVVVTAVTGHGGDPKPFEQFLKSRRQVPPPEAFFPKPIDREQFIAKVGELLGG